VGSAGDGAQNPASELTARRIGRLNRYAMTLDELKHLKHEIVKLGRKYRAK
jgi:hypothetical protein